VASSSRRVVAVTAACFFTALPFPLLAPSLATFVAALLVLGFSNGALDVSMNAQAAAVERRWHRPIMSSFHAMWSLGGLVGAGVAGDAGELLGRHVRGSSDHRPRLGQLDLEVTGRRAVVDLVLPELGRGVGIRAGVERRHGVAGACCRGGPQRDPVGRRWLVVPELAREAEVHDAHLTVPGEHHVVGLEVAMHETGLVRGDEAPARLRDALAARDEGAPATRESRPVRADKATA